MDNLKPFITGERYNSNNPVEWEEVSMDDILELKRVALMTDTFDTLMSSGTFSQYVRSAPCILHYYKKTHKSSDAFFALKVGYLIEGVPSIALYRIREAYNKADKVCNKIIKHLSSTLLDQFFTLGYFKNGITLEQIIRLTCDRNYIPLVESGDVMHGAKFDEALFCGEVFVLPKGFVEKYPVTQWFKNKENVIYVADRQPLKGALSRVQ